MLGKRLVTRTGSIQIQIALLGHWPHKAGFMEQAVTFISVPGFWKSIQLGF